MEIQLNAMTREGRHVKIVGDPYLDRESRIWVNGLPAEKTAAVLRFDSGLTVVDTDRGKIMYNSKHSLPTLNGEILRNV